MFATLWSPPMPMVEFEPVALRAPSTLLVHVAASVSVALTHGTPDRRGDVARRGWWVEAPFRFRLRKAFAGSPRLCEASGLEPFELLGDGLLDDRGQIAVRDSGTHQGSESLQLAVELGAGRELHLVPARG
jgi:hypothetical protein